MLIRDRCLINYGNDRGKEREVGLRVEGNKFIFINEGKF